MNFDYTKEPGRYLLNREMRYDGAPLVSIITPYYNAGKYFEQTFNCVMNQTFPWFEWIIVDDGSADAESVSVLAHFAAKDDNKTIGLLLCKTKDRIKAEYALRDINKPIGISDYKLGQAIARREGFETYYALRKQLKDASYDTPTDEAFQDKPLLPSVIFVKCTEAFAQKMQDSKKMWPYRMPGEKSLCPITQRDIDVFRTAVESGCRNLEVIDENLAMGDKVRVLDGIFKDQEGYIVKIRGDKRFVISIPGVVAIATIYIPKHLLALTP